MKVDSFVAGYTGGSILYKNRGQFVNGSNYFTDRDVHNNVLTSEEYEANLDIYKGQALRRAMSPVLYNLKKNTNGTISYDTKQLSREEVLAIRSDDLKDMEINWAPLKIQLANRLPNVTNLDHVGFDIDYFASEYVQYKNRILENFTGEKQMEELQKLDSMILTHVENYAEQFSELVGNFLDENGVHGEQTAIKESIKDLFLQRTAEYIDFIQKNENYAGVKGTEDEWLLMDHLFMGEQLRYAFKSQQFDWSFNSKSGYSIDDLTAVGTLVKETWDLGYQTRRMGFNNRHKSEEEFGVELGFAAMKYVLILDTYEINSARKAKLDTAFQTFISNQNEQAKNYIIQMRNDPFVRDKQAYALDWNQELVMDIIRRMVENKRSSDLNAAFKEDISLIMELYRNRMQSHQTRQLARYHPYHNSWVKSQYVGDWNQFLRRLSLTSGQAFSQYILQDHISILDIRS